MEKEEFIGLQIPNTPPNIYDITLFEQVFSRKYN